MTYLRDVLAGKKQYFHIHEVNPYDVPKFKDISVNKIYEKIKEHAPEIEVNPLNWLNKVFFSKRKEEEANHKERL